MAMKRTILSMAVMALLIELGMAANYTVGGGPNGWDTSTNLQSWASSQAFLVGDNLIFQYTPNHNLMEVTKAGYDSCNPSNLLQIYNDGNTVIPLSAPGKRYFICGVSGHCLGGMKVEIDTLATTSSPPADSPSLAPNSPPSTPSRAGSPESPAPTASAPRLSPDSPLSNGPSSSSPNIAPSTETPQPAPAPSAAPINYVKGGFRASLLVGFSTIVMLLAF
ncbi:Blue copper protein [Morus notabilis]|uniref:Blue copper protein n=1 Tax=Morus notabilis TaxID=981085 RepID=W9S2S3_9ROSA|nr:uclacyanin 1 [Morus notabilis]EXC23153.1 Blue copper protein [Morus notabilis]